MPTDKEVVVMVMQNADVLLSVDSSCKGVGSDFTDSTIGQFLSSFLQYYTDTSAKNSISIQVVKGDNPEIKQDHWKATFMINGQTEGENWRWGISFVLLDSNHHVIDSSFRCLGGG